MKVNFLDLIGQNKKIEGEIDLALKNATRRSDFILGKQVRLFEQEFAHYCGLKYGIGLNSGTDALFLSQVALGLGPGDEVILPAFTFIATANSVSYTGAKPVFVDIDEKSYNIDPKKIEKAITKKTKAIIPVHLFGQCADLGPIMHIARKHGLKVIEDACQAHGAVYKTSKAGSIGDTGCFSFYPTKNLGGFGDGGMVVTDNKNLYERLLILRDCGRKSKYEHVVLGYNSRLDTIQAAGLRVKLKYLDRWNRMRRYNAQFYDKLLEDTQDLIRPFVPDYCEHVYHIYAVRVKNRKKVMKCLQSNGIGTIVHYPIPLHLQQVYRGLGYGRGDFPVAERICQEIISLPMHPLLTNKEIKYVAGVLKKVS